MNFRDFGSLCLFALEVFKTMLRKGGDRAAVFGQIWEVTTRSLPTVIFAGVFVGAILVIQFNLMLLQFDAQPLLGGLNTSALIREVAPLIISFLLAGKIGAYTTAELGTMRVTEQIEAMECLGVNPVQYLIVPRWIGIVLASLLLLLIGLLVSVIGSATVAWILCKIQPLQYIGTIPRFNGGWTLFGGMFKSAVYGTIVASVSCHQGYNASGGAAGVGSAVTRAAIYTCFYIVIANTLCSRFLDFIYNFAGLYFGRMGA